MTLPPGAWLAYGSGVRLTVLGGCGGWPAGAAGCSGYLIEHDGFRVLADPGYATFPRLLEHCDAAAVDAVLVSHGHPDHCADLSPLLRARALSALGGAHRVGLFLGPLIGAGAISLWGVRSAYVVAITANLITALVLLIVREDAPVPLARRSPDHGSRRMLAEHWRLFATLGLAVVAVAAVRAARQTVVPIWALHIGLGPAQTSLVFAVASAVDMALFYPAGKVMDVYGRIAVALPAMTILGGTLCLLADRDLTPYRRNMTAPQIEQLQKQYIHKRLLEQYKVPRLSLFYM